MHVLDSHPNRDPDRKLTNSANEDSHLMPIPPPKLPLELIQIIIDFLHGDRRALGTCARVCRAWVSTSRRNLFAKVYASPRTDRRDVARILSSRWCTISPAVRHLHLDHITRADFSWLEEVTAALSNLRELSLRSSNLTTSRIFPSLDPILQNLDTLHLVHLNLDSPDLLFSLLRRCLRLQSLVCDGVRLHAGVAALPSPPHDALTPGLRSLEVHQSTTTVNLCMAACWTSAAPQIATLDLDLYRSSSLGLSMVKMAEAVGSTLQVIRLSVYDDGLSESLHHHHIDFNRTLKILASLHFYSCIAQIAPCLSLLAQLRSAHLDFKTWDESIIGAVRFTAQALPHFTSQYLQEVTATLVLESNTFDLETISSEHYSPFETPRVLPTLHSLTFRFASHQGIASPEVVKARELWIAERFLFYAMQGNLNVQSLTLPHNER